jgi:hypothetical protein
MPFTGWGSTQNGIPAILSGNPNNHVLKMKSLLQTARGFHVTRLIDLRAILTAVSGYFTTYLLVNIQLFNLLFVQHLDLPDIVNYN